MFAAMLFTISILALSQFGVYYWRAVLAGVAAQPISDRVLEAARVEDTGLIGSDFEKLAGLHSLTPILDPAESGLGLVHFYYRFVRNVGSVIGAHLPSVAEWAERERVLCARYAAVQIDRRLQSNLALAASLRSC
jgi:hypothetical protein